MDEARLALALSGLVGAKLATDLASDFVKIRLDFSTKTLERSSPGKFVESFVQCLQQITRGEFDAKPDVDKYLNDHVVHEKALPDGLRFCGPRIARSIYALRSKRIVHKGEVDPNRYDLAYIHQGVAWILAELIRHINGIPMDEAGRLIDLIQAPVGELIEDIEDVRLVQVDVGVKAELLILLKSHYPDPISLKVILTSMHQASEKNVRNRLGELCKGKPQLVFRTAKSDFRLTQSGYDEASKVQSEVSASL